MTTMPADSFEWQEYGTITPEAPENPPPHTLFQLGLPTVSKTPAGFDDWTASVSVPITILGTIDEDAFEAMLLVEDLRVGSTSDLGLPDVPPIGSGWPDGTDSFATMTKPAGGGSGDYTIDVFVNGGAYPTIDEISIIGVQIRHDFTGPAFVDTVYQTNPAGSVGLTIPANGWYYFGRKVADTPDDTDEPYALAGDVDPPYEGWARNDDYSHALETIEVAYGATDATSPPRTLEARVDLAITPAGPCPPAGRLFRLALSDAGAAAIDLDPADGILFTGEVTDPTIDPKAGRHRITAAGTLGRHFRRTLASESWGQQTETARVTRIMDQTGIPVGEIHAGTTPLAGPGQDDTAGALLDKVTGSTGGAVVEQPDGTVDYLGPDHRRGTPVELTMPAATIVNTLTWSQHVDDLINELEVAWSGGVIMVQDPASIATHGVYPGKIETSLTTSSEAYSLGQLIVGRRSEPVWQLPDLEVDLMHVLDDATRGPMLQLRYGDLLEVTDIPAPHAYTGDVKLYVEGWSTRIVREAAGYPWRWRYILAVSDRTLSGVSIRWMDVDAALQWHDVDPTITWLDVATIIDDEDLLGEPGSTPDLVDGGAPGDTPDTQFLDGGAPGDTPTTTYDGGSP
jgi:hypothetical protein